MDYVQAQDNARRKTWRLVLLFCAAVVGLILLTNLLVAVVVGLHSSHLYPSMGEMLRHSFNAHGLAISTIVVLMVAGASAYKYIALSAGGRTIAEALGGRQIPASTQVLEERRLLNLVEEMALAAGMPVPPVYLLPEQGINAFAAGRSPDDAVIGVTQGAMRLLSRDEMQAVIGHEFSHILNGDSRLNLNLIAILHGILFIGLVGYGLLRSMRYGRVSRSNSRGSGTAGILLLGVGLIIIGYAGTFFGKLIKAGVSRQREYLADAAAVQFTRNPSGMAGALKKIGAHTAGSHLEATHAEEAAHLFFGQAITSHAQSLFATHPPLPKRILAVEPGWDGKFPPLAAANLAPASTSSGAAISALHQAGTPQQVAATTTTALTTPALITAAVGTLNDNSVASTRTVLAQLPQVLLDAAHETYSACALIYAMLLSTDSQIQREQLSQVAIAPDANMASTTAKLQPELAPQSASQRLLLLSMAMPALKGLSSTQYQQFVSTCIALIRADKSIDLFEWVLHRLLVKELKPFFETVQPPRITHREIAPLADAANELLSALARKGHGDAQQAHAAGLATLALTSPLPFISSTDENFSRLGKALNSLRGLHPLAKPNLLKACAEVALADNKVSQDQWALLQGVAASLDCPLPPQLSVRVV